MEIEHIQPKRNIVSVRLNDEERELLEQLAFQASKTVSDIVRESMQMALRQSGATARSGASPYPGLDESVAI